jgi:hypothetical protein
VHSSLSKADPAWALGCLPAAVFPRTCKLAYELRPLAAMGCMQSRGDESPRSAGYGSGAASGGDSDRSSDRGGAANVPDAAFLAAVHRKRVEENNPQAAHLDKQDALGRYEAAAESRSLPKPFDYRNWETQKLRDETARIKGGAAAASAALA